MRLLPIKGSFLAVLTAALLGGCAATRTETTYVGYGSIKDRPAPSAYRWGASQRTIETVETPRRHARTVVRYRVKVKPAPAKMVGDATVPSSHVTQRTALKQSEAPAKLASAPPAEPPALPTVPVPSTSPQPMTAPSKSAAAELPKGVSDAAPAVTIPRAAASPTAPTPGVVQLPAPPPAPPAAAPTAPVVAAPVAPGQPGPQVALQSLPKAPAANAPAGNVPAGPPPAAKPLAAPKIGAPATSELQRVFIARSVDHLKASNISNARAAVNEALRLGETPEALVALAQTYDPLVLQAYPRLVALADGARALDIYKKAADQGYKPAQDALAKLQDWQSRRR